MPTSSETRQDAQEESPELSTAMPKLVALDLDYTVWPVWVDTHVVGPLKRRGNDVNRVYDRHNKTLSLFPDVPKLLLRIKQEDIFLAACSRTHAPEVARQALTGLYIPSDLESLEAPQAESKGKRQPKPSTSELIPIGSLFDQLEIYPGSKLTHFRKLHEATGIAYEDMLFFDDESRNVEVETLGVHFALCPDGLHSELFEDALKSWRQYRATGQHRASR